MLDFASSVLFLNVLCVLLCALCLYIACTRNLFSVIIYLALYSVSICALYLLMDAPDVAMTEAAIGACLTTVIYLTILHKLEGAHEFASYRRICLAILLCSALGCSLIYLGYEMVDYGNLNPVHNGDSAYYLEETKYDIALPSFVAAILASYRGFDTLGETTVIMMAGLSCILILAGRRKDV